MSGESDLDYESIMTQMEGETNKADMLGANHTSGMLFFRDAQGAKQPDGRRLVMVVGVLALPDELRIMGEHQYPVTGMGRQLTLHPTPVDRTEEARGQSLGNLVQQPIWRT